jgi:hypothetical protein
VTPVECVIEYRTPARPPRACVRVWQINSAVNFWAICQSNAHDEMMEVLLDAWRLRAWQQEWGVAQPPIKRETYDRHGGEFLAGEAAWQAGVCVRARACVCQRDRARAVFCLSGVARGMRHWARGRVHHVITWWCEQLAMAHTGRSRGGWGGGRWQVIEAATVSTSSGGRPRGASATCRLATRARRGPMSTQSCDDGRQGTPQDACSATAAAGGRDANTVHHVEIHTASQ